MKLAIVLIAVAVAKKLHSPQQLTLSKVALTKQSPSSINYLSSASSIKSAGERAHQELPLQRERPLESLKSSSFSKDKPSLPAFTSTYAQDSKNATVARKNRWDFSDFSADLKQIDGSKSPLLSKDPFTSLKRVLGSGLVQETPQMRSVLSPKSIWAADFEIFLINTLSVIKFPWMSSAGFKAYIHKSYFSELKPLRERLILCVRFQSSECQRYEVVGSTERLPNCSKSQIYLTDPTGKIADFSIMNSAISSIEIDYALKGAVYEIRPYADKWSPLAKVAPFHVVVPKELLRAGFYEVKLSALLDRRVVSYNFRVVGMHSLSTKEIFVGQRVFERLFLGKPGILAVPEILPIESYNEWDKGVVLEKAALEPSAMKIADFKEKLLTAADLDRATPTPTPDTHNPLLMKRQVKPRKMPEHLLDVARTKFERAPKRKKVSFMNKE